MTIEHLSKLYSKGAELVDDYSIKEFGKMSLTTRNDLHDCTAVYIHIAAQ